MSHQSGLVCLLFIEILPPPINHLCQELVGHRAHDVDGLLLGLDDVTRLGVLRQALQRADLLACAHSNTKGQHERRRKPIPPVARAPALL